MQLSLSVLRPEDFLLLRLYFRDIDLDPPSGGQASELRGTPNGVLIVEFQPQHIAEQAFWEASPSPKPSAQELKDRNPGATDDLRPPGWVQSRIAGPSRLVFDVPAGEQIPYTLEGVLEAIGRLPLRVTAVSSFEPGRTGCSPLDALLLRFRTPPAPPISEPTATETAIEAPYRLLMSPDAFGRWSHQTQPIEHGDWTELWQTRLGSHREGTLTMRAVWSPDWHPSNLQKHFNPETPTDVDPFRMSLDARDRNEIVHLTSNYHIERFIPDPVDTEQMALTSLGASLKLEGNWAPPTLIRDERLTVQQWRHEMSLGRDQLVRVVYAGYLLPFGHRASLVKVTERKFVRHPERGQGFVAYLRQRMFIIVRERELEYRGHRALPFARVLIRTRVTPDLLPPQTRQFEDYGQGAFWPHITTPAGNVDFLFDLSATDQAGQAVQFSAPLLFVDQNVESKRHQDLVKYYNTVQATLRQRDFQGQGVAYAPPKAPRDTALETKTITFQAETLAGSKQPHFRPIMQAAEVDVPAVKQVTGKALPLKIKFEPSYVKASGSAMGNVSEVFARVDSGVQLGFGSTERVGGLVAPNFDISGLSRRLGPVGDVDKMIAGTFDPAAIFKQVKLLGAIKLSDIIEKLDLGKDINKAPNLVTVREGEVLKTTYTWTLERPQLKTTALFEPGGTSKLSLVATFKVKLDTKKVTVDEPEMDVEGKLTDFAVLMIPSYELVKIGFTEISFKARPGKKVDTAVQIKGIEFKGILEFVNELRRWIPLDGFNDPPAVRLVQQPEPGVDVGYSMGIPTISVGILSLQNVSLGASAYLPFAKAPMNFRFAFCERHQPFTLTVSLFGGGGFFALNVGLDKVVMIEAALEFGASAAINLGVAKGHASMMAGFYFQKAGDKFTLTGYFRASGSLSVLGIISVSLVFYLGLNYQLKSGGQPGKLWGQASLTVKIEILFISKSVSVKMEREFAGSDPKFHEMVSPAAWQEYCGAFAEYA